MSATAASLRTVLAKGVGAVFALKIAGVLVVIGTQVLLARNTLLVGQSFRVEQTLQEPINIEGRSIPLTRLIAHNPSRIEPMSYWIRIGDRVTTSAMDTRLQILWEGLQGRVVDGASVRVSGVMNGPESMKDQFAAQDGFIKSLAVASGDATRNLLLGDAGPLQ